MTAAPGTPYIGLRAFTEGEASVFFGRERETIELLRLVESDLVSIVYGVSGVGKSSLLNAGLFPRLAQRNFLPVRLRLDHHDGALSPTVQVLRAVHDAAAAAGVALPEPEAEETLWEFFHRAERAEFWTDRHRLLTPVLALDQYEEFFSLGQENAARRERTERFHEELLALLENSPPAAVRERQPGAARKWSAAPVRLRVLLILREDFIAQLLPIVDALAERLPSIHRQKLHLRPFGHAAAREAIEGPALSLGGEPPDEAAAQAILRVAAGEEGEIEPARLALVLSALDAERRERGFARITAELANLAGEDLFARLVDEGFAELPMARTFVEEEMITPAGYRNPVTADQAASRGVDSGLLAELQNRQMLAFRPGLPARYELVHDLLCPALVRSRDARREAELWSRTKAEQAAAEERARAAAAHAEELAAALRLEVRARRRARRLAALSLAAALLSVGFLAAALISRSEAVRERAHAQREGELAQAQRLEAERQRNLAEQNRQAAEAQKAETEKQRQAAVAGEKAARTAEEKAVAARTAADELIHYMQYDLSSALEKVGRIGMMDEINGRIREYHERHPPGAADAGGVREQSVALEQQGDILATQGKLDEAAAAYGKCQDMRAQLALAEPENAERQRDLSVIFEKLADVLFSQGKLAEALEGYQKSQAMRERLARQEPAQDDWQELLSISFDRLGEVYEMEKKTPDALQAYRQSLAIRETLAAKSPENAGWQRNLSVSLEKVGTLLKGDKKLEEASAAFRRSLKIREELDAKDPGNPESQRDLSVAINKLAELLEAQGNLEEAVAGFRRSQAIRERLAARDPENAQWQTDLATSCGKLAGALLLEPRPDRPAALKLIDRGLEALDKMARKNPPSPYQTQLREALERLKRK